MTHPTPRSVALLAAALCLTLAACSIEGPPKGAATAPATANPDPIATPAPATPANALPGGTTSAPAAPAPAPAPTTFPRTEQAVGKQALDAAASSLGAPPVGPSVAREQQFDAYRLPHGGALPPLVSPPAADRERYAALRDNGVVATAQNPFSTFSIDVDTGSYANVRRFLNAGRLPPPDAVRVEEMVNYFPYHYAEPPGAGGSRAPFGFTTEVAATPWNPDTLLLRIGIKAFDAPRASLPPCNLVFLVDVSGSMNAPNKLPLLKNALRLMVDGLRPQDRVALVTYASGTRVVLPPTSGTDKATIRLAIDQLVPGGSTAGAAGIQLAYQMAQQGFLRDGINRILLATDGDFNVGITDFAQLKGMVEEKRRSGVSLSTLGFGEGNYREDLMEQLADAGDGNYSYIDTLNEAHKVLVEEASSTLSIVARDVKIQVEFNPAVVTEYRLIGYENRALAREDFRNDRVDAGEIGAGHTVTALYELVPVGKPGLLGESRYSLSQTPSPSTPAQVAEGTRHADEIGMLRLRYKSPSGGASQELAAPIANTVREAGEDLRFAAAVAAFGQELRGGRYLGDFDYARIAALADGARGRDPFGYRGEFVRLVKLAGALATRPVVGSAPAN